MLDTRHQVALLPDQGPGELVQILSNLRPFSARLTRRSAWIELGEPDIYIVCVRSHVYGQSPEISRESFA